MTEKQKNYLRIGTLALVAIAVIILIVNLFKPGPSAGKDHYEALIAAKNETIKVLQDSRDILQRQAAEYREHARQSDIRDSILIVQYQQNQAKYQSINRQYAQISERISRIANNADSIRAAYREY